MGKVRTVEHWWNGVWGRLARLDVWLRTDGERWDVWVREGGVDSGRNRHTEYDDETSARVALADLLDAHHAWRRMDRSSS
ncbi:hypothetical protein KZZ52_41385 [Dactylosporangium sp. AC04546]|uniref:hypothetical protein n=1 Tax=Dactylosporangium sp. AC04546 TaxID=2862460 RepID=UPI001EDFE554|nr:hypothetical protein [Dactylosporangium sp. AC04546]WVK80382.1 hypothetical protein KZZ52_41385 [Dactylosporangium sp. AC04546]